MRHTNPTCGAREDDLERCPICGALLHCSRCGYRARIVKGVCVECDKLRHRPRRALRLVFVILGWLVLLAAMMLDDVELDPRARHDRGRAHSTQEER